MNDLLEFPITPEYYPEDTTFDLWVYLKGQDLPVVLKDVTDATRLNGFWVVSMKVFGRAMEALFPSDTVVYFKMLANMPPEDDSDDPTCADCGGHHSAESDSCPGKPRAVPVSAHTHDPLCIDTLSEDERANVLQHVPPDRCDYCRLIAKVRSDEREQAAQRVADPAFHDGVRTHHPACIAAARGEKP